MKSINFHVEKWDGAAKLLIIWNPTPAFFSRVICFTGWREGSGDGVKLILFGFKFIYSSRLLLLFALRTLENAEGKVSRIIINLIVGSKFHLNVFLVSDARFVNGVDWWIVGVRFTIVKSHQCWFDHFQLKFLWIKFTFAVNYYNSNYKLSLNLS